MRYIGLGTTKKTYIISGNSFIDVTPIRLTSGAGDPTFSASDGSSVLPLLKLAMVLCWETLLLLVALHHWAVYTAAVLNQEYEITSITDSNTFTITAKDTDGNTVTANASDTGNGGSSTVAAYQINIGLDVAVPGGGWSSGPWGDGTWGTAAGDTVANTLRLWSLDNFGEDLVLNARLGAIFLWDATFPSNRAQELINNCRSI